MRKQSHDLGSDSAKRLMLYSAAAGVGAFAFGNAAQGAITVVDPVDFGVQGAGGKGWVTETPAAFDEQSLGIDILRDGGAFDVGIFTGTGYGGYLVGRTDVIGYESYNGGTQFGSGQLELLTNNVDNPDGDGYPTSGDRQPLQGFFAGQIIGDNDGAPHPNQNFLRGAGSYGGVGDWGENGVSDNYGNPNGTDLSYIGFEIDINNNGLSDGFGWIELIVRDLGGSINVTVTRWAYTDDGSTIAAGQVPEPASLMLLAAGAGSMALRRRKQG